jgi:glutathione S-transferase
MSATTTRLYYFPVRGRGEQVRLLLHALDQPFEEVTISHERLLELKAMGPSMLAFGALPVLEDGDLRLAQGPVIMSYLARRHGIAPADLKAAATADSITLGAEDLRTQYFNLFGEGFESRAAAFVAGEWTRRWLPSFEGLLTLNGSTGFFVGKSLTHADVAVWDALDATLAYVPGTSLSGHPHLKAFFDAFRSRPTIAAHLARRPVE